MTKNLKRSLKEELRAVWNHSANVHLGKQGLSKAILAEIDKQLTAHSLIKVKFLRNFPGDDLLAAIQIILKENQAELVEKRGRTIVIYRPRKASRLEEQ